MIRDYVKGVSETLDVTIVNAGSGKNSMKADGMFNNAFYDLAFYSDSGYTVPISSSSYESSTIDAYYTAQEGFNIYSEYRILDPTYQTGTIYARFESIGIYTSGEAVGVDIINIDDDYAYTTNPYAYKEILLVDGLTADITITVTDGGSDPRNIFEVINNDSTYNAIVTDSTYTFTVQPGKAAHKCYYNFSSVLENHDHEYEQAFTTPADWTNATETITHNLNADIENLEVELYLTSTQTGVNKIALGIAIYVSSSYGAVATPIGTSSFGLFFSKDGIWGLAIGTGAAVNMTTATSPQYKTVVYKR